MPRIRLLLVTAWLVGLLVACTSSVRPDTAGNAVEPLQLFTPLPEVFTANQPAVEDWHGIREKGVTTVINLRMPEELEGRDERSEVASAGMAYVELPVAGAKGIGMEQADALRAAMLASDGPVLVHCASGNRAGALLALVLVQAGLAEDAALEIGRSGGMTSAEEAVTELLRTAPQRTPQPEDHDALCAIAGTQTCGT
jgi:uncharacterized protein (TIGR01244 family)